MWSQHCRCSDQNKLFIENKIIYSLNISDIKMSSNNWMIEMDKMLAVFTSQATSSLINMRKCFEDTGRTFNKDFKELFFAASNNWYSYLRFHLPSLKANIHNFFSHLVWRAFTQNLNWANCSIQRQPKVETMKWRIVA